jgi:hypothetical protein
MMRLGPGQSRAGHGGEAHTAEAEDEHRVAGTHPRGVPSCPDPGQDRAAEQRRLGERYVVGQRHHRTGRYDDLLGHRPEPEAGLERGAIGQRAARRPGHPLDGRAEPRLPAPAVPAAVARHRPVQDHVLAERHSGVRAGLDHDSRRLVAEDLGVRRTQGPVDHGQVGVADADPADPDPYVVVTE